MIAHNKKIFLCFCLSLATCFNAYSQLQSNSSIGGQAGAPMRMGFGTRGIAMGNAMTALINGDLQAYYNPASVPFESVPTVFASYGLLSFDRKLNFISYTNSLKPNAGLSIALINSGVSNIDGRDRDGIHTEYYSTSENSFMFTFGLRPIQKLSLGVTVKLLYYVLFEEMKSTTAAIDVGVLYLLTEELTIGAVIQDIKGKYNWNSTKLYGTLGKDFSDFFPLRKRIGINWSPSKYSLNLAGEFEMIGSASFTRFGSEIEIYKGIHIRGGIDQISLNADLPVKPALGLSFETEFIRWVPTFQYSYVFEPYSSSGIHIVGLSLRFK